MQGSSQATALILDHHGRMSLSLDSCKQHIPTFEVHFGLSLMHPLYEIHVHPAKCLQ